MECALEIIFGLKNNLLFTDEKTKAQEKEVNDNPFALRQLQDQKPASESSRLSFTLIFAQSLGRYAQCFLQDVRNEGQVEVLGIQSFSWANVQCHRDGSDICLLDN